MTTVKFSLAEIEIWFQLEVENSSSNSGIVGTTENVFFFLI